MGLLDKLGSAVMGEASKNIGSIFKDLGSSIAQFVNTPEDKIKVQTLIQEGQQKMLEENNRHSEAVLENASKLQLSEDTNTTDRWKSDMTSQSWLSANIRPLTLASLLVFLFIIIISESVNLGFTVKESYVSLMQNLLLTVIVAYFGSRGIEKYQTIKNNAGK